MYETFLQIDLHHLALPAEVHNAASRIITVAWCQYVSVTGCPVRMDLNACCIHCSSMLFFCFLQILFHSFSLGFVPFLVLWSYA